MSSLPTTLPKGWDEIRPLPVRSSIAQRTQEILGDLPADKHVAVVAVGDFAGYRLAAMARGKAIGGEWTFTGWVGRKWGLGNQLEGGAELRWTI